MFQHAAQWILQQAGWVIVAAVVVVGLIAFFQRRFMQMIATIIVGGLLSVFAFGGESTMQSLANTFRTIFGI